jgi:two-component sensor histidine kinase
MLFAVALTLPLAALSIFAFRELVDLEEDALEERVLQVARAIASTVDRELSRALVTLETLATSPALESGDLAAFHEQARRAIGPNEAGVLLVDRSLKQLLNTRATFGTDLPLTSDPETAKKVFATGERQVSDAFLGVVSKRYVVNVEVPVRSGEPGRYVLILAIDAERFASLLESQGLPSGWMTEIIDRKGSILARSHEHKKFVGQSVDTAALKTKRSAKGVFQVRASGGEPVMGASAQSGIAGWLISATLPTSMAETSQRRSRFFSVVLIGCGLILGGGLAFLFGRYINRAFAVATSAAVDVGHGKVIEYHRSALTEANSITLALSDASKELQRRHDQSEFLLRELAHRSKNQLAVIMGMATQTARHTTSVAEFIGQFGKRIQGLAKSQDLVVQRQGQGASLRALVLAHLDLFGAQDRAEISGPEVTVNATVAQNLGFALHELATNATKYGALATAGARLRVEWRLTENGRLHIHWIESGLVHSTPPVREGFGSLVTKHLVPRALQGTATTDFKTDSFRWYLDIPSSSVIPE